VPCRRASPAIRRQRHNAAINARQFGGTVEAQTNSANRIFGEQPIAPGTLYDDQMEIEVGGVRFELHHCKGETDDHTWVWCPERSVVCPGDLFIWAVPNDGNPQKVQRYPWDRAKGLRAMAALEPRVFCPGHGGPIAGDAAKIQRMLIKTEAAILAREGGSPKAVEGADAARWWQRPPPGLRRSSPAAQGENPGAQTQGRRGAARQLQCAEIRPPHPGDRRNAPGARGLHSGAESCARADHPGRPQPQARVLRGHPSRALLRPHTQGFATCRAGRAACSLAGEGGYPPIPENNLWRNF
jgi:glyoxylase-like metal-dependent hydrolase (beta-lactamase superfamily II)